MGSLQRIHYRLINTAGESPKIQIIIRCHQSCEMLLVTWLTMSAINKKAVACATCDNV